MKTTWQDVLFNWQLVLYVDLKHNWLPMLALATWLFSSLSSETLEIQPNYLLKRAIKLL